MIKKLRAKLILACMFSLAVVLLVILGGVNLMSYQKVVSDADTVLSLLAANDGAFPKLRAPQEEKDEGYFAPFGTPGGKPNLFNQRIMSPETPYESRFFSVLLGEDGQAVETDTGQIAAVDAEQATDYAQKAAASGKTSGFLDDYRFLVQNESGGIRIIFLDCGCSATSFLRNWDSILEKKRANLRSISEPARLRQPPPRSTGAAHARGRAQSIREERRIAAPPVLFALLWVRLLSPTSMWWTAPPPSR